MQALTNAPGELVRDQLPRAVEAVVDLVVTACLAPTDLTLAAPCAIERCVYGLRVYSTDRA